MKLLRVCENVKELIEIKLKICNIKKITTWQKNWMQMETANLALSKV